MATNYPALSQGQANRRLEELRSGPLYPHHERVDPSMVDNSDIRKLIRGLDRIRGSMGRLVRGRPFDRFASQVIHQSAKALPIFIQEDPGFWRWLAIEHGADIVEHRYGVSTDAGTRNFGLGPRWDSMFMRLWFCAEVSFDPNESDPYRRTKLGDVDFWVSGVLRHRYGSARNLVKAFAEFAYDDPSTPERDRWQREGESDRDKGIRIVYKNLSRLHATVAFEMLSLEQCTEILHRLSKNLPRDPS